MGKKDNCIKPKNTQIIPNGKYLNIINCGLFTPNNTDNQYISMLSPANDFLIAYFTNVEGNFKYNHSSTTLKQGDLIFIEPNSKFDCKIEKTSTYYLIQFSGNTVKEITSSVGLSETGVYSIGFSKKIVDLFCDLIFSLSINSSLTGLHCNSIFFEILSIVLKQIPYVDNNRYIYDKKIIPAINHMKLYYYENHSMEFYASLCNMSLSYFKHSFHKNTLVPPLSYLHAIRFEKAKYLLVATQMTVSEVSSSVGFNDPKYFCRAFKKYVGISPSQFYNENFKIK